MRTTRTVLAGSLAATLLLTLAPVQAEARPAPTEVPTDTSRLTPRTSFTMAADGSSGRTAGGGGIPNIDSVKRTIATYYGDPGTGVANVAASPYVGEMDQILTAQTRALQVRYDAAIKRGERPALVFDVDDTTLLTYDLTAGKLKYTSDAALRREWVTDGKFVATPGMVTFVKRAHAIGYTIFGITGRKRAYRDATLANLKKVGYGDLFTPTTLYTRWAGTKPGYLACVSTCTTVEYKAGTRKRIERARGFAIVANFGDQWSDLMGGYADHIVKLPNPMYDLPSRNLPGVRQPRLTLRTRFVMAPDGSSGAYVSGERIPNVDVVKKTIAVYYGDRGTGYANKKSSPYITELKKLTAQQRVDLKSRYQAAIRRKEKPALVFDTDDTTLFTYDMEVAAMDFNFDPVLQNVYVQKQRFPATPTMPAYVDYARSLGYTIFGLTGRNDDQKAATIANLAKVGYDKRDFVSSRFFTKWTGVGSSQQPGYITCATAKCTTIEYKSQTRKHIEQDLGYTIVANYGDQYSDLQGRYAERTVKLPNPTYYLP
jgi:predicted secreted acid phosphatase